ncbi:phage integrase N-terminal domain-containing protein [Lonsdalea quercina]|uniref:phage integrase N-terminal domain-containing protein n=1 Tax=Lonsdalea quercina TaxID=71657 RepID=UPI003974A917
MDDLTWTLNQLCRRNRDGSHTTQADRKRSLTLMARQLREAGFRQMRATSLKGKHITALLTRWQSEDLSAGTLKNRLAHLRWWAEKIGKPGLLPADKDQLGIPKRCYVTNQNKAQTLNDRLDHIALKGTWTKGGKARTVPITTPEQRAVLDEAHALAGAGSLIPAQKTYIQQRHLYDGQCKNAGLSGMHGLRHRYAQMRYEILTGWLAPAASGPGYNHLTQEQQTIDREARQIISRELGHERLQIVSLYLGR